jgi:hypothetical protein
VGGGRVRIPFLWAGSASSGVSYHNGELDAGLLLQGDIPGTSVGGALGRGGLSFGYQTGDFYSNRGSMEMTIEAHYVNYGLSISQDAATKDFSGASITFGPGLGAAVVGTKSNTISVRQVWGEIVRPVMEAGRRFSNPPIKNCTVLQGC